jgi:hypothetical protein
VKKVYEGRPDGGPTTRRKSKMANLILPHAKISTKQLKKRTRKLKAKTKVKIRVRK